MTKFRQILMFLMPFKRQLVTALCLTGVLTLIGMAPPLLMRRLINDIARQGRWGLFPLIITLLFAVPILRAAINIGNAIARNKISLGIMAKTRKQIFRRLMRLSMEFYGRTPVGSLTQRIMGDVGTVSGVVTGGLIELVADVVAVVFAVIVMFRLSPPLSLLTLGLLPLYVLNYWFFSKRIQQTTTVLRSRMDHISSMLQERLSAHELIQSYGQEKEEARYFSSYNKQIMDASIRGAAYSISFNQLSAFLNKIGNTLIYCLGCYFFVKERMEYGDVVAFCAYATQLLGPVVRFSSVANQVMQVGVSVDRINGVLNAEPGITDAPDAVPVPSLQGEIEIDGVAFEYEHGAPALKEVRLTIPAGSHIAVVGPPGAGKSTLATLLRRYYDPSSGRIRVDGKSIRKYRLKDYRTALAMVLPESTLFDGTIRDNLLYGKADAKEEQMRAVSKAVGLHSYVEQLSEGYDTRLGTGGLTLAAGDRQRIGIARALISEPFVLIADDATASLDPESAESINAAIHDAMKGRTYVLIASRLLMARNAERVVVMEEGRVLEDGTHDSLLVKEGSLYRDLYGKQYGEERLPPVASGDPPADAEGGGR